MADMVNVPEGDDYLARVRQMATPEIRNNIVGKVSSIARAMYEWAIEAQVLEERGEEVPDVLQVLRTELKLIAARQLSPELYATFGRRAALFNKLRLLPLPEQKMLAEGKPVKLVVPTPDGTSWTHRCVPLQDLGPGQIAQVLDVGAIRNESQQITYLEDRRQAATRSRAKKPARHIIGAMEADLDRKGMINRGPKGQFNTLADLKEMVAYLEKHQSSGAA